MVIWGGGEVITGVAVVRRVGWWRGVNGVLVGEGGRGVRRTAD